ncbi:MAG: nucleotide-binding universal stress UspA family protein [Saprospiraceae bacterium]|jgi:nucleotide-binding universal stress UspA family protein
MKILCPIDFSETSINAAKWITNLMHQSGGGDLHLSHFIFLNRRSTLLLALEDILKQKAEEDIEVSILKLKKISDNVRFSYSIQLSHPKEGIVNAAKKENFDLIVIGTTALTALKDIVLGSVTEYILEHSAVPVLAIPSMSKFKEIKNIALAADDLMLRKIEDLKTVAKICEASKAKLQIIHVTEQGESPFEYDPVFDMYFKELDFNYVRLQIENSLAGTLNNYCEQNNLDIMEMIHHMTNWIKKLFVKSTTKSELYNLRTPLLVLNER